MRVAVFGFLSALAVAALPLAANAVPRGPTLPAVVSNQPVEAVAGRGGKSGSWSLDPVGVAAVTAAPRATR
jgi:hypothetical protein